MNGHCQLNEIHLHGYSSLQVMHKLRLVPLGSESVEERVAAFRQYNDEVRNKVYASFKRNTLSSDCPGLHHPLRHHCLKAHLLSISLMIKIWERKAVLFYGKSLHGMLRRSVDV